ncbi:sulfatase [Shouchella shacheensis]|uniref:sulfatase n=1 Tax=Shouchella shacheensis TaxID=1649580 RepID=UPI00073FCC7D|nr:sulfatase [Shouchella shacheensis]
MKIIFVSIDTLRADRLGCYGYHRNTSPYLDQVASEGVLFEQAFAADIPTEVAHTGIFTGKVGLTTGVVSHGSSLSFLPKSIDWLPTLLRNYGYTTAAVDNLYHLQEWFARGYQYYVNSIGRTRWIDGRRVNDLAKLWIKEHQEEDFFLFLHYWDPHTPYLPPEKYIPEFYPPDRNPYDGTAYQSVEPAYNHLAYPFFKQHHFQHIGPVKDADYINALYDSEIRYLDDLLKELDEYLKELGIYEETFLILFGDHGESLTEHQIYWDHCGLYEPTVRVPMIMRWPGRINKKKRVKGQVQQVDMMPTILEALSIPLPESMDGRSLWSVINGEKQETHPQLFLSECAWQASRAVRTSQYKFIRTMDAGVFKRPERELYDLQLDPAEKNNLIVSAPTVAEGFERELDQWIEQKLQGNQDPMEYVLEQQGLPFRKRIERILSEVGLTWEEWKENPSRERFDYLHDLMVKSR